MVTLGYKLSSEEFGPRELVRLARTAEDSGFRFALISDHFHPWTDAQGQSPFVWSVLGGVAEQAAAELVTEDAVAEAVVCGPDATRHLNKIREYADAGFEHVCGHQVGPDQEGFLRFYAREVLPRLGEQRQAARGTSNARGEEEEGAPWHAVTSVVTITTRPSR